MYGHEPSCWALGVAHALSWNWSFWSMELYPVPRRMLCTVHQSDSSKEAVYGTCFY